MHTFRKEVRRSGNDGARGMHSRSPMSGDATSETIRTSSMTTSPVQTADDSEPQTMARSWLPPANSDSASAGAKSWMPPDTKDLFSKTSGSKGSWGAKKGSADEDTPLVVAAVVVPDTELSPWTQASRGLSPHE